MTLVPNSETHARRLKVMAAGTTVVVEAVFGVKLRVASYLGILAGSGRVGKQQQVTRKDRRIEA